MSFQKLVFTVAVKKAKEIRDKNPKLSVAEATAQAWKSPEVAKARAEWEKKKKADTKKPAAKPAAKPVKKAVAKKGK